MSEARPAAPEAITPARFEPPGAGIRRRRRRRLPGPLPLALLAAALLLLAAAWFLLSARAVSLAFTPAAEQVRIEGGLALPMGARWLLRPGTYTVRAEAAGYHPLEASMVVEREGGNVFAFEFRPLPGRLTVLSTPPGAVVEVDGEGAGQTPLQELVLEPGKHELVLRAQRHQVHRESVTIEGRDRVQTLEVELVPAWAEITVDSKPAGATLLVDGEQVGVTPIRAEIGAGSHSLELRLAGYEPWRSALQVEANQPQTLPTVELAEARGRVRVSSEPSGASVAVGGKFAGRTPVTVSVAPGRETEIEASLAGHRSASRRVTVASGAEERVELKLTPILGEVRVSATPADAELLVDGQSRGAANQTLSLLAVEHVLTIRKPGFTAHETRVTPRPGLVQEVSARLVSEAEARLQQIPARLTTADGQVLVRVTPGRFTMGAPRREQGRRANEVQREVELTRSFYLGIHEVTNARFRAFRPSHSSGIFARNSLDVDSFPVVQVSWEDAVAYCNWLSQRDGLPAAYRGGELVQPVNTGYRLPSEAEWAHAARFAAGRSLRYPWGDAMPPPSGAGNFADVSARAILPETLEHYDDTWPVAAAVGKFAPNALGIFDLGGNVSEWVHDRYSNSVIPGAGAERDPFGPASGIGRVVRGSSWRHARITELRLSWRDNGTGPRDDLGFRLARYLE